MPASGPSGRGWPPPASPTPSPPAPSPPTARTRRPMEPPAADQARRTGRGAGGGHRLRGQDADGAERQDPDPHRYRPRPATRSAHPAPPSRARGQARRPRRQGGPGTGRARYRARREVREPFLHQFGAGFIEPAAGRYLDRLRRLCPGAGRRPPLRRPVRRAARPPLRDPAPSVPTRRPAGRAPRTAARDGGPLGRHRAGALDDLPRGRDTRWTSERVHGLAR